jgi:DNA-binding NarL/FixJ family response regulator
MKTKKSINNLLTETEQQIIEMLAQGETKKYTAKKLEISYYSLCKHTENILKKTNARNTTHAVYLALRTSI